MPKLNYTPEDLLGKMFNIQEDNCYMKDSDPSQSSKMDVLVVFRSWNFLALVCRHELRQIILRIALPLDIGHYHVVVITMAENGIPGKIIASEKGEFFY